MDAIWFITFFIGFIALHLACAWLDHKHNWQFVAWFNGEVSSPFQTNQTTDATPDNALESRIQNLEKIVTTEAYELNQKINRL